MKHFNKLLQEKLNSFEYPYEQGAWESLRHKMRMKKIIRWATAAFVAATVVTTSVLLLPNKEIKPSINNEIKNNVVAQTTSNKENTAVQPQHHSIQNHKLVSNTDRVEVTDNTNKQIKTSMEVENKMVANDLQNNGANLNVLTTISFTKDIAQGCAPLQVKFNAVCAGKYTTCIWDFGDGTTSFESNPVHVYKKGGKYKAFLTIKTADGKNIVSEAQQIQVYNKPKAIFEYTINENCIQLLNNSKQSSFKNWYFNDSLISNEMATVCIKTSGTYNVSLVVENNDGCSDSSTQKIEMKYHMPIKFANAFTPDGDGINDLFGPQVFDETFYSFKIFIYNKAGKCVFEANGNNVHWDGTDVNTRQQCMPDDYFYKVLAVDKLGNKNEFSGKIKLKR